MRTRFALALCLAACSTQESSRDAGSDAGVDAGVDAGTDAGADAGADAGTVTHPDGGTDAGPTACNALVNVGAVVQQMYVPTAPVTGGGGAIAEGTYALTSAAIYSGPDGGAGPTGTKFRDTLAMSAGGTYERVVSFVSNSGTDLTPLHQNGGFATDGGSIHITVTCPTGAQPFTSYDSDGTTVRIYAPPAGFNPAVMFEYTRQ